MDRIIILGKGGHAKSIADTIERQGLFKIAGYVVNDSFEEEKKDYPIIGNDEDLEKIYQKGVRYAAIGIGYLGKGTIRNELYERLKKIGYFLPIITDPTAIVSDKAEIAEGTFLGKGAIINAGAHVGKMCILNTGSIVEHDCQVGDFSHIAVGAVLCGDVHVGNETLVGANATIIQGRKIGNRCIIGAGEVIRKNILNED